MNSLTPWILLFIGIQVNQGRSEFRITKEPKDYTGFMNQFKQLGCEVSGEGITKYEWHQNGSAIPTNQRIYGQNLPTLYIFQSSLENEGIYQLYVTSTFGRIFGREIKVEFTVVGKFLDKETKTLDVIVGQFFRLPCPRHSFTRNTVYKWGGSDFRGSWFYPQNENVMVLEDGTLFFSHVTEEDVRLFRRNNGVSCMLNAVNEDITKIELSGAFKLNEEGVNKTSFGPIMEKIPNKEAVQGKHVLLRCAAAGYPTPTYRWERIDSNGVKSKVFDQVNGIKLVETNKLLIIQNVRNDHAGIYKCYATIEANGARKTAVEQSTLIVREEPAWVEGSLIKSATPEIFAQHVWTCNATGDPEPSYYWYANATIMESQSGRYTVEGGTLTFHQVTPADNGMYQCVSKNKFGFQYQTVSMVVKVKSPTITKLDSQTTLLEDTSNVILCRSDALPPAVNHWLFNGVRLGTNDTMKYGLRNNQDLVIYNITKDDAGNYTCVAKNMFGEATESISVTIAKRPTILKLDRETKILQDTSDIISCRSEAVPPAVHHWLRNGVKLETTTSKKYELRNNQDLVIHNVSTDDVGNYTCVAKNMFGEATAYISVTIVKSPTIMKLDSQTTLLEDTSNVILCRSDGLPPAVNHWLFNGVRLETNDTMKYGLRNNQDLVIYNITKDDAGNYTCVAKNMFGEATESISVTIAKRPTILKLDRETKILLDTSDIISCRSEAVPPAVHHWLRNGVKLETTTSKKYELRKGQDLVIHNVSTDDVGNYTCVAKNMFGEATAYISVTIVKSPTITTLDRQTTLLEGTSNILSCRSDAIPPAVNHWLYNGVRLETNATTKYELKDGTDLVINNVSKDDAGNYTCVAKNMFGNATRNIIVRTGTIMFKTRPKDELDVTKGKPFSLFCEADSEPPLKILYKWRFQGQDMKYDEQHVWVAGNKTLLVLDSKHSDSGTYECIAYTEHPVNIEKVSPATVIVRGVPDAPESLSLHSNCSNFKADLSWKIGYKSQYDSLTRLLLQWSSSHDNSMWYNYSDHVNASLDKYEITGLRPWSSIRFRLVAINKYGVSQPSPATEGNKCTTPASIPSKCPEDVKGNATKPQTIKITWKEVPSMYESGPGFHYIIRYRKPNSAWQQQTVGQGPAPRFTITNASQDQEWEFTVQSRNSLGPGPKCKTEYARSAKEGKSSPTPIYRRFWFYIIIVLILLLLLIFLLLLFLRRKPKQTYKVSERERKYAPQDSPAEPGVELLLKSEEPDNDESPQGGTTDVLEPDKPMEEIPEEPLVPSRSERKPALTSNPEISSLDDYDGEDDDFSEHGSFIGQYSKGGKISTSQSSLPAFV